MDFIERKSYVSLESSEISDRSFSIDQVSNVKRFISLIIGKNVLISMLIQVVDFNEFVSDFTFLVTNVCCVRKTRVV